MEIVYKKTDSQRCVPFNSCHPRQWKNKLPFTLARQVCFLADNSKARKIRLNELQKVRGVSNEISKDSKAKTVNKKLRS